MKNLLLFIVLTGGVVWLSACKKDDADATNQLPGSLQIGEVYFIEEETFNHADSVETYYNYGLRRKITVSGITVLDTANTAFLDSFRISFYSDSMVYTHKMSNFHNTSSGDPLGQQLAYHVSGSTLYMDYWYFRAFYDVPFSVSTNGTTTTFSSNDGRFQLLVKPD
jgi:hypothetical protein